MNAPQRPGGRWRLWAAHMACVALLLGSGIAWPQARRPAKRPPKADPAPPLELRVPFRTGEKLEYRGGWQWYNGGATLTLAVRERRDFNGHAAWHFRSLATTLNPLRYLFILDDQFDSYSDAANLASLQYELYLREQNKHEDHVLRMSHEGEPAPADGSAVRVPAGTRDPLGALYFLRSMDWTRSPAVAMPVYDGKKLYELRARLENPRDAVEVPAGTFTAARIDLRIYDRGRDLTQVRISIWFANDAAHTPVRVEAELPIGPVRAELTRAESQP